MTFTDLGFHRALVERLHAIGYRTPRPIQAQAAPPIIEGRDVIGLAQTGTGKTAAFAAPIAHRLMGSRSELPHRGGRPDPVARLRALVVCPTRELAMQVAEEFGSIVRGTGLRVTCVYGSVGLRPQAARIAAGVDVLVGTPGRIRELLAAGALRLDAVRHLVIDEADRMMDMGFRPQVDAILARTPEARQLLLFSATMAPLVESIVRERMTDPVRLEVGRHTTAVDHVQQRLIRVDDSRKVELLLHLLTAERARGVIVYCRTRRRVGWVATALLRHGITTAMLHGDRTQAQRTRALDQFASGDLRVIVATDVAARGLHVEAVRTVVNYDVPLMPEDYVHRVGRAAHGGVGTGDAITLVSKLDEPRWETIARIAHVTVKAEVVPGFEPRTPAAPALERTRDRERAAAAKVQKVLDKPDRGHRRGVRRSRRSRPIRPGDTPGGGVKRPD